MLSSLHTLEFSSFLTGNKIEIFSIITFSLNAELTKNCLLINDRYGMRCPLVGTQEVAALKRGHMLCQLFHRFVSHCENFIFHSGYLFSVSVCDLIVNIWDSYIVILRIFIPPDLEDKING